MDANVFNLKVNDFVVVTQDNDYLGKIGRVERIYRSGLGLIVVFDKDLRASFDFLAVEPLVRANKPEPIFVPKFKKGDKIIGNQNCLYNKGPYTCRGNSLLYRDEEIVFVDEMHSVIYTSCYDKVPDFVSKFKKDQIATFYDKSNKSNWFTVLVLEDSYPGFTEIFKGKVLKKRGNISWSVGGVSCSFNVDAFELGQPFEPKIKKGEKYITESFWHQANADSWENGNGEEMITDTHGNVDMVKHVKKITVIE